MDFCQVAVRQENIKKVFKKKKKQKNKLKIGLQLSHFGSAVAIVLSLWPMQRVCMSRVDVYN